MKEKIISTEEADLKTRVKGYPEQRLLQGGRKAMTSLTSHQMLTLPWRRRGTWYRAWPHSQGPPSEDIFHQKEKTNIYDKFHFGTGWEPYQCSSEIFEGKGVNYE